MRVAALDLRQNLVFAQYLEWTSLTKFGIHIIVDRIYIKIIRRHFCKFATELPPLIDFRIWFLLHILRMNVQNLTKFCIHIIIDKIYVWNLKRPFFCKFATVRVPALDLHQNSVFLQYLENEWTEFCVHIIIDKIYIWMLKRHFTKFAIEFQPLINIRSWFCTIS